VAIDAVEAVRVIQLTREAGVPFAVLGDVRRYMETGFFTDIDMLAAGDGLAKLWIFLTERLGAEGYVLVNSVENEYCLQLYWRHPATGRVLHVDLLPHVTWRGVPYLRIPLEGASIDESRGFPVVADMDRALYRMMGDILWRGAVTERHAPLVRDMVGRHRAAMLERLAGTVGSRLGRSLLDSVAGGARRPRGVRARLLLRAFSRHPVSTLRRVVRHFRLVARRYREYPGLVVALLGPDGSGKTSVISRMARSPDPFMHIVDRHLFPGWLPLGRRGTAAGNTVPHPHDTTNRTAVSSALKLVAWYLEFTLGWALRLWRPLVEGSMVIFDRYAYDILVDPRRYRYGGPSWLARAFARAVPRPDLCIALDAPAQMLAARKREIGLPELERQRGAYRALVVSLPGGRVVDASRSPERVAADIEAVVLELLAERAQKRSARLRRALASARPG